MKFLYQLLIKIINRLLPLLGFFNSKLKAFVNGRKNLFADLVSKVNSDDKIIWFHAASLGEFEQALPVINAIRNKFPKYKIAVSFFSPSGFEVKKNDSNIDIVTYLPLDTKSNAEKFIKILNPEIAFFVKYEVWPNFLNELSHAKIKTYLISGLFRENQLYFRPMGKFMRKALHQFEHLFVQNEISFQLLKDQGFENVSISGDTRFDRVTAQLKMNNKLPFLDEFTAESEMNIVFGSSWPEDESVYLNSLNKTKSGIKFIIAPHQIKSEKIQKLKSRISKKVICYSEIENQDLKKFDVLIIDTIGLLTKIYSYADIAYVGGGMGTDGLHNILEPAAFGVPIIIGKNFKRFPEAISLRKLAGLYSVSDEKEFDYIFSKMIENKAFREKTGEICGHFVNSQAGATKTILATVENDF
ncbi:3-deoxy-D-manno-octulosonic acid transferase [Psychroflexus aestuariivivens]|uniref:3-deoxy-D-manno-octulosonic acid transferase n=1 Tax=Psychroflexus aestuariivivens TaxID=1795040 RepID=UPI000FDA3C8B|nr:glycosyltransferase N-terminal domain-containing protein [Psychroflexus aestuariivivens]